MKFLDADDKKRNELIEIIPALSELIDDNDMEEEITKEEIKKEIEKLQSKYDNYRYRY